MGNTGTLQAVLAVLIWTTSWGTGVAVLSDLVTLPLAWYHLGPSLWLLYLLPGARFLVAGEVHTHSVVLTVLPMTGKRTW
jgi:hypothetical protein